MRFQESVRVTVLAEAVRVGRVSARGGGGGAALIEARRVAKLEVERRSPHRTVCGKAGPTAQVNVELEQRLVDASTIRYRRCTTWARPRVRHP